MAPREVSRRTRQEGTASVTARNSATIGDLRSERHHATVAAHMERSSSGRYEAAVATMVAVLAVAVSAYTAYVQRQQVRAQVFPILEINSGNEPELRLWIANKGVGPALIRAVHVTLDGKPVRNWHDLLQGLYGQSHYSYAITTVGGRVLSPNETLPIFVPRFDGAQKELAAKFDEDRSRIGMEICYCSTLGDCWRSISMPNERERTEEAGRCPQPDADSFQQ